jgi:hypothetical protein
MTSSVQANDYLQGIPVKHLFQQQKVNAQLWHWWNLADHERAMNGPYNSEKNIYSAGVELARDPNVPPRLSMGYTICSRRWRQEQEGGMDVRIGDIIFAKNGTGAWDTTGICTTYALERVDEPHRWNKYCVSHLASERFDDVIRAHAYGVAMPAAAQAQEQAESSDSDSDFDSDSDN